MSGDIGAADAIGHTPEGFAGDEAPGGFVGGDGVPRCAWSGTDPIYQRYHDEEWGNPLREERGLFENLSLEGFQAGLSWLTILKRRTAFRTAFADFDIDAVARFTDVDVERLVGDSGIIRNRRKILATIGNARLIRQVVGDSPGTFADLLWSYAPEGPRPTRSRLPGEIPTITPESRALSAHLRRLGFRFVGPTTVYALMQSAGMVDDHISGCWRSRTA